MCQPLTGQALRCGCGSKMLMCDTSSKNVSSVGGAYTTFPATNTALADRRGHGAGGGHFGEQEPRRAVTGITTHRDRLVRGTHTTFPTPDRTAPRERLYRAWRRLFGHVRCSRRSYRCHHTRPPSGFARPGGIRLAVAALPRPRVPPCASAGTASTRISQGSAHCIFRCCLCIIPSSHVSSDTHHSLHISSDTHHSLEHFPCPRCPRPGALSTRRAAASPWR